jgi:hypothetical protein
MNTTVVVVIAAVAAVVATGVVLLFVRLRNREDDSFYHFRCPKCKRRLRYLARQVGRKGKCSNCAGEVVFPPTAMSID